MGTREVTIRFCDCCDKEILGRLTLHTCPCCGKDICVECQEKEDAKHKPKEKKPKQVAALPAETMPGNVEVDIATHCSKCGMVTTTVVDGKPLCLICQTKKE